MRLPTDRPLTNYDLSKYVNMLKIPHFRGIYMRDTLPKKPRNIECWILNHDLAASDGSHWTCLAKIGDRAWYFDSFGSLPPPLEVLNYLGKNVEILYNYQQYQDYETYVCGQLCIKFLFNFWRGRFGLSDRENV